MIGPQRLKKLVPSWLEVHGRQLPPNHAVLIDDAQLLAHAREGWKSVNLDKAMSMSRHRETTIIYSTQVAGGIDVNIIRRSDVSVFKQPPLMSEYVERREVRKLMDSIDAQFLKLQKEDPSANLQQYSWVISNKPRFEGMVGPTPLPSYWSEELSKW